MSYYYDPYDPADDEFCRVCGNSFMSVERASSDTNICTDCKAEQDELEDEMVSYCKSCGDLMFVHDGDICSTCFYNSLDEPF